MHQKGRPARERSERLLFGEDVTVARLEITRMYEADLLPPRVSAEHPGDLFHLPEGRHTTIGVSRTGTDGEGNPAVLAGESITLDELLSKGDSLDDGCVATGERVSRAREDAGQL